MLIISFAWLFQVQPYKRTMACISSPGFVAMTHRCGSCFGTKGKRRETVRELVVEKQHITDSPHMSGGAKSGDRYGLFRVCACTPGRPTSLQVTPRIHVHDHCRSALPPLNPPFTRLQPTEDLWTLLVSVRGYRQFPLPRSTITSPMLLYRESQPATFWREKYYISFQERTACI